MTEEIKNKIITAQKKYGEAFYLLNSKQFENNFLELKKIFQEIYPNFNIAYSYKTNYVPQLCKIVNELGGYAEVVSEMELKLAIKVGVNYKNIIWNGPIKDKKILKKFLLKGGIANLDSIDEFEIIKKLIEENPTSKLHLGIRCNFDVKDGVLSRFGFDVEGSEFNQVLNFIVKNKNIKLINLQCHFAKRQIEYWLEKTNGMLNLIEKIGIVPDRIDLGGGLFGKMEPSLEKQFSNKIPTYKEYAEVIANIFKKRFKNIEEKPQLILEPGSALVGDCMNFVATVKTLKNIRGKYFATVLGSQKNISMGSINPPIEIINLSTEAREYKNLDIVGFTCIENDVLYKGFSGRIGRGDLIVVKNCGSYSLVMKPPFILPNFPVLDISRGKIQLIKEAETFEDIFDTYIF